MKLPARRYTSTTGARFTSMPTERRLPPAPVPACAASVAAVRARSDLLLRERRRPRQPAHEPALLVGEHQERRVHRARGVRVLQRRDHAAQLGGAGDVRPEEDDAGRLAGADPREQRRRWRRAGVRVDDPLAGELGRRETRDTAEAADGPAATRRREGRGEQHGSADRGEATARARADTRAWRDARTARNATRGRGRGGRGPLTASRDARSGGAGAAAHCRERRG